MNLSINVQHKLSSLLRRGQLFFAISYNWTKRQLVVHPTQDNYFEQIINIREMGMAKRSQCYVNHFVDFGGVQYAIYLVSFGDIRKWKMIYGQNPIAKNFNICMLDFVFLFVQSKQFASKKIQIRMRQLFNLQKIHDYQNMRKTAQNLFGGMFEKEITTCQQGTNLKKTSKIESKPSVKQKISKKILFKIIRKEEEIKKVCID